MPPKTPDQTEPKPTVSANQGLHRLSHLGRQYFNLIEFDDAEEILLEIRKHIFGQIIIILTGIFVMVAITAAMIGLALATREDSLLGGTGSSEYQGVMVLIGFLLTIFAGIGMLIGVYLYRSNVVFITNQKIAQVLYLTIFNRKISQLNIGDVQDVTVSQNGFTARLFNYGTLVIETAGEQNNYTFTYVPNPYESSKTIILAHERNIALYGN